MVNRCTSRLTKLITQKMIVDYRDKYGADANIDNEKELELATFITDQNQNEIDTEIELFMEVILKNFEAQLVKNSG